MLNVDRSARVEITASPERCRDVLADIEDYPSWSSLVAAVDVLERGSDGAPERILMRARVIGLSVEMTCTLGHEGERAVLRRLPHGPEDPERFDAAWTITPIADGTAVELHVVAALDVPGPARLVGGRVAQKLVDDLLADFARTV